MPYKNFLQPHTQNANMAADFLLCLLISFNLIALLACAKLKRIFTLK